MVFNHLKSSLSNPLRNNRAQKYCFYSIQTNVFALFYCFGILLPLSHSKKCIFSFNLSPDVTNHSFIMLCLVIGCVYNLSPASITYHPFFAFAEMLMPFPMFLLADLLWLSTPVWLGVECFKRWNKVFHALKLLVPSNETFSFKALKL